MGPTLTRLFSLLQDIDPLTAFFILENEQPQPEVCGPGNFCNSFRAVATQFCQLMSRIIHFILLASWEHPLGHWFSLETPCVPVLNLSQFSIFRVQSNRPTLYALSRWGCTLIKRKNTQNWYFQFPEVYLHNLFVLVPTRSKSFANFLVGVLFGELVSAVVLHPNLQSGGWIIFSGAQYVALQKYFSQFTFF